MKITVLTSKTDHSVITHSEHEILKISSGTDFVIVILFPTKWWHYITMTQASQGTWCFRRAISSTSPAGMRMAGVRAFSME